MSLNDTCTVLVQPAQLMPGERLRVAYVSSDFGNHPLSHLMGSVFGLHDRSRVSPGSVHDPAISVNSAMPQLLR